MVLLLMMIVLMMNGLLRIERSCSRFSHHIVAAAEQSSWLFVVVGLLDV